MGNYKVLISASAEKTIRRIPKKEVHHIMNTIQRLAGEPFPLGARKLVGYDNILRIRVGRYRIIYEIEGRKLLVLILKIGHRKDVYR